MSELDLDAHDTLRQDENIKESAYLDGHKDGMLAERRRCLAAIDAVQDQYERPIGPKGYGYLGKLIQEQRRYVLDRLRNEIEGE